MRNNGNSPYWNAPHYRPMHRFEAEDYKQQQKDDLARQWREEETQRIKEKEKNKTMKVRIHRYESENTAEPVVSYDVSIGGSFGVIVELPVEHYEAFCTVISDYEDCQETLEKMYEIASGRKQETY